jgi:hypothetical protein
MNFKKHIILFCIITVIEMPFNNLISQTVQIKPTRQSSFEAFSQGNYEKAYSEFTELLKNYSKDPLYKYYSGVCLVKLNKNPGEAITLLQQAIQGTGEVKALPSDGLFYLGRAQQMSGKFSEAVVSYNSYTNKAGKKAAKELGVPEFVQQCNQKKGQIADSEITTTEVVKAIKGDSIKPEARPVLKEQIQANAGKETPVKETLPLNYDILMGDAIEFQFKSDSVLKIINEQKKSLEKLTGTEKEALKAKIAENEKIAAAFQSKADQKYKEAKIAFNPGQDTVKQLKEPSGIVDYVAAPDTSKKPAPKIIKTAEKAPEKPIDSVRVVVPSVKPVETYSFFEVLAKPVTDPNVKIVIDPKVPDGLIYRIQIGVFRNPVQPSFFKGLTPVYGFKIEGTDKTSYSVGMFRKLADATKALAIVKAKGFKDAFIVALSGNKSVSSDRAAMMEKEWGRKPFIQIEKVNRADTITPTLIFRVEVTRALKPLKEDAIEGIRKIAGNRGLDILILDDGKTGYLIGKFITFETAAEYSDLLKRNGYKDAQVVAWLGKKQIPIDTARQLVDKLK